MQSIPQSTWRAISVAVATVGAAAYLLIAHETSEGLANRSPLLLLRPSSPDSLIRLAEEAIAQGRPWRATEILSPVVRDADRRTPAAVIVAARAAVAWRGWSEAERILSQEAWLDSLYGGEGRELLARAQLGTRRDSAAARNARLALATATSEAERGARLVLLARALSATKESSGAALAYIEALAHFPEIGDWLRLRAAEWTADSARRAALIAEMRLPHVIARSAIVDAIAAENSGDTALAIARYARAGDPVSSFRLRLGFAAAGGDSAQLRRDLVDAISRQPAPAQSRAFVDLLDAGFRNATPAEELMIARALGPGGGARTASAYARAFNAGLGSEADRFQYAGVLTRIGSNASAISEYAKITSPPSLAAAAAYLRARTLLRADMDGWREALRAVVRDFPSDTSAATALYLLADLASDEGRDEAARDAFLSSARRFPGNSRAPAALFHAAMISFVLGDHERAAEDFGALRTGYPQSSEAIAALYWRGRALESAGEGGALAQSCARIRAADSLSYYSVLCARATGTNFWTPVAVADSFIHVASMDSIRTRVRLLRVLDLESELSSELDRFRQAAGDDPERLLAAANALRELGYGYRAVSVAQQAQSRGARRDARLYRLLYPATHLELVAAEASQYGLDLDLLAGLIRQESLFNPGATSPAGARGLMQIMPSVGDDLARANRFPVWDPVLLWQPDVNVRLGVKHFADLIASQAHVYHVLASYNAGASRVSRWLAKRGVEDPEVFVERIPFVETRDYVRILTRNREMYRALYQMPR